MSIAFGIHVSVQVVAKGSSVVPANLSYTQQIIVEGEV